MVGLRPQAVRINQSIVSELGRSGPVAGRNAVSRAQPGRVLGVNCRASKSPDCIVQPRRSSARSSGNVLRFRQAPLARVAGFARGRIG